MDHIADWFHFRCCFGFGEILDCPQHVLNRLWRQLRGGHFGVLTGMVKFTGAIMHRNINNCKGQRTQIKIWFAFCRMGKWTHHWRPCPLFVVYISQLLNFIVFSFFVACSSLRTTPSAKTLSSAKNVPPTAGTILRGANHTKPTNLTSSRDESSTEKKIIIQSTTGNKI